MLNDVHPPPLEPGQPNGPNRPPQAKHPRREDRAHTLDRKAEHGMGTNLVFSDPEDRGDSFNTTMSAVIVGSVLVVLLIVAWLMWR